MTWSWRIWHLETLSLDGSEDCGGSYRLQIKTISVLSVSPIHIYSLDSFEILLANNIIPHLASELLTIACWLCCTRWKCRQNRTPRTEFKVFMSPVSHVLAFLTIAEIPGMSSGGVAGKCAARKSHIVAAAVTAVTVFVVGWPISSVLFEASIPSMIFNDLARNASSTLSLWGCTRCQRPAKANCCFGKRRINIHQNYNLETAPTRRNERSYTWKLNWGTGWQSYNQSIISDSIHFKLHLIKALQSILKHPIQAASCICCSCTNGIAGLIHATSKSLKISASARCSCKMSCHLIMILSEHVFRCIQVYCITLNSINIHVPMVSGANADFLWSQALDEVSRVHSLMFVRRG